MNALIVIDIQNDFLPGGSLAIKDADTIVEKINKISDKFDYCVFTKDWHPAKHVSFKKLWAPHCVQYSHGAEFPDNLLIPKDAFIVYKGANLAIDSYSAFFDNNKATSTPLSGLLLSKKVDTVYLCGIATDYCVKYSAIDAIALGYKTFVIEDLTKAVHYRPSEYVKILKSMEKHGIEIITSSKIN